MALPFFGGGGRGMDGQTAFCRFFFQTLLFHRCSQKDKKLSPSLKKKKKRVFSSFSFSFRGKMEKVVPRAVEGMKPGFLQACAKGAGWETLRCLIGGCAHLAAVLVAGILTGSLTSALVGKREGNLLHPWKQFSSAKGCWWVQELWGQISNLRPLGASKKGTSQLNFQEVSGEQQHPSPF